MLAISLLMGIGVCDFGALFLLSSDAAMMECGFSFDEEHEVQGDL